MIRIAYSNKLPLFKKMMKLPLFTFSNSSESSSKDEKFWEDYKKRKAVGGGKLPALESQEIQFNKIVHSWKYSSNHCLSGEELFQSLKDLKKGAEAPFIIVDVREDSEFDLYKMPMYMKDGAKIPIVYRNMLEINYGNWEDLPFTKYIICIDSLGLRGRRAAHILHKEGYLSLYVEGGYDMFLPLLINKQL